MKQPERAKHNQPIPGWRGLPWWRKARICCGQPTFIYSLLLGLVGASFLLAAPLLDPDLAVVGMILLGVAVLMLVTFWLLAYHVFGREQRGYDKADRAQKPPR